jgi:hypothetical protein
MKLNKRLITGIGGGILAVVVIILITAASAKKKEAAKHETEKKLAHQQSPRPVRFEKVKATAKQTAPFPRSCKCIGRDGAFVPCGRPAYRSECETRRARERG